MEVYANNRDTEQDTKWKNHNEINNTHFETQKRFNLSYGRKDVLDPLEKNIIHAIPNGFIILI